MPEKNNNGHQPISGYWFSDFLAGLFLCRHRLCRVLKQSFKTATGFNIAVEVGCGNLGFSLFKKDK
jgi:hypothetical protein